MTELEEKLCNISLRIFNIGLQKSCKELKDLSIELADITSSLQTWHTGTPTEEGDYICAFKMCDDSIEYGWCRFDMGGWDILCDYDPEIYPIVAWQKITPFEEATE